MYTTQNWTVLLSKQQSEKLLLQFRLLLIVGMSVQCTQWCHQLPYRHKSKVKRTANASARNLPNEREKGTQNGANGTRQS